jgi:transcriptional regulator with XRE-family HTH domain
MLATKLLEVANIVGLSQSDVARHFGISRAQIHLWASGKRVVPKKYREALVKLVSEAIQRCLPRVAKQRPGPLAEAVRHTTGKTSVESLVETINILLEAWMAENLEAHGLGPSHSVQSVLEALEDYKTMSSEEMRKPANAQRLRRLSAYLQQYATMLGLIGPILDTEEDDVNASHIHSQSHEPGNAGAANSGDYQAHA